MDLAYYFCSSQILMICSLLCIFGRGFLWHRYARDERPQPQRWTLTMLGLGALFLIGSLLSVWMLAALVNQRGGL